MIRQSSLLLQVVAWFALWSECSCLRILLTNNNGLEELGLQNLKTALRAAGHDVFVYAPSNAFAGASVALTLPVVNVTEVDTQENSVSGYTATCVLVGISAMSAENATLAPDLVLSGINDGFTSGSQDLHSGTLGGALTGLAKGIPSIAILSDSPDADVDGQEVVEEYFSQAATFVVNMVDTFQDDFVDFPVGVGLKVIYPAFGTSLGVVMARDNSYFFASFSYGLSEEEDTLDAEVVLVDPPEDLSSSVDSQIVAEGFISALPIKADISVGKSRYNENFLNFLRNKLESEVPFEVV